MNTVKVLTGNATVDAAAVLDGNMLEVTVTLAGAQPPELRLGFDVAGRPGGKIIAPAVAINKVAAPKPPGLPLVAAVFPEKVVLQRDASNNFTNPIHRFTLAGSDLKKLSTNTADVQVLGSSAVVQSVGFDSGTLVVELVFSDVSSPIALRLCVKEQNGACGARRVLTPPVSVAASAPRSAPPSGKVTYTKATNADKVTHEVEVVDGTDEPVLKQSDLIIRKALE